MDKNFWNCYCLTNYIKTKGSEVCESCQALKKNQEGYDTIRDYDLAHNPFHAERMMFKFREEQRNEDNN